MIIININAQSDLDSLKNILESNVHDTVKLEVLLTLKKRFLRKDTDQSIAYFDQIATISKKINREDKLAEAHRLLGIAFSMKNYSLDTILQPLQKGLVIAEKTNQLKVKVNILNAIALTYRKFGQRDKAFTILQEALIIAEKKDFNANIASILINLAVMLKYQDAPKKSKLYYLKAIQVAKTINAKQYIAMASNNLAALYNDENEVDSALVYYNKSLDIKKNLNDEYGMVMTLSNIGGIYAGQEKYEIAYDFYQKAYEMAKRNDDSYGLAVNLSYFANASYEQKKYRQSIKYTNEELEVLGKNGDIYLIGDCYDLLSNNYAAIGEYKKAYKYTKLHQTLNDSIFTLDKNEQIRSLEIQYDVAQKDVENEALKSKTEADQKTIKNQTFAAIGLILSLLFAIGWSSFVYRANKQKQELNQKLESRVQKRTKELQVANENLEQANHELLTFNYIASHDIKEPIRNIGSYVGLIKRRINPNDQESLKEYFGIIKNSTTQIYTLLEDVMSFTKLSQSKEVVTTSIDLNILVENVELSLENNTLAYKGQVEHQNLPIIQSNNSLLLIALKNIIENGLRYNTSTIPTVKVNYTSTEKYHRLDITDNGIGIESEYHDLIFKMFKRLNSRQTYQGSGLGLAITKIVVGKLNGTIEVKSKVGEGSTFSILLPKI